MSTDQCPICRRGASCDPYIENNEKFVQVNCSLCGIFRMSHQLFLSSAGYDTWLERYGRKYKGKEYILSGVTRNAHEKGDKVKITEDNIANLMEDPSVPSTPLEVIDVLIQYLCIRPFFEAKKINLDVDYSLFYAKDQNELGKILIEAEMLNYLVNTGDGKKLTLKGWERADEKRRKRPDSKQAFVAMWFNDDMEIAYNKAIIPALDKTGYKAYKVNDDLSNTDMVVNTIIAKIRESRFLVADLTGIRRSVIFEAGFALGLEIEVIWTCCQKCKDYMKEKHISLPFDVSHFPIMFWKDHEDLKKLLIAKIKALGPKI